MHKRDTDPPTGDALLRRASGFAGRIIANRYRLDAPLAEGGMAVVYRGWHVPLDQPIAVKVLKDEFAQHREAVARFLREARAGARLRGKHVAQVLDIGRIKGGAPFMVTELLEGETLGELLLRVGPLPVSEAVKLLAHVCDAIAEAHQDGLVHRDLKPDNLFLAQDASGPIIKILDFGVAKRLDGNDALTETQRSLGSPHYMAPEQFVEAGAVDTRADIWSLGVVLYELLTGVVPFDARTVPEVCALVLRGELLEPSSVRAELPRQLDEIVTRCLMKRPSERYASADELRDALRQVVDCQNEPGEPLDGVEELDTFGCDLAKYDVLDLDHVSGSAGEGAVSSITPSVSDRCEDSAPNLEASAGQLVGEGEVGGATRNTDRQRSSWGRTAALLAIAASVAGVVFGSQWPPARASFERNVGAAASATLAAYRSMGAQVRPMLNFRKPATLPESRHVDARAASESALGSHQIAAEHAQVANSGDERPSHPLVQEAVTPQSSRSRTQVPKAGTARATVGKRYAISPGGGASPRPRRATDDLIDPYPELP